MVDIKELTLLDKQDSPVLQDVSFHVNKGDFMLVFGGNYNARMRLLNCIMGYETYYSGQVSLSCDADSVRYVPGDVLYEERMTVEQYIDMNRIRFRDYDVKFTEQLFQKLGIDKRDTLVDMTYEDNKIVQLTAALSSNPELLIIDRAEKFLGFEKMKSILKLLELVNKRGVTIIYACNDYETVKGYCNRYVMLNYGKIIADNPVPEDDTRKKVITVNGKRSDTLCKLVGEHIATSGGRSSYINTQPLERIPIILYKLKFKDYLVEEMTLAEELTGDYSRWKRL